MKVKLLKIEVDEVEEGYAPSGLCVFEVNKKTVNVLVHSTGDVEIEDEDEELTEEESDAVLEAFESSAEVDKAFPTDLY